jgi:CheY-like chemotaxis protein
MKVLIIDDDHEDTALLSEVVREIFPSVTCLRSHDYLSAKAVIEEEDQLDFIFLDAMMYPIGGLEALRLLSQSSKLDNTKIIINSGVLNKDRVREFVDNGADQVIQKPSNYDDLRKLVKDILGSQTLIRIRIATHEVIVHTQIESIERGLKRPISFDITLNKHRKKSNLEFDATEKEISVLRYDLLLNVFCFDGVRWTPHI